jgi:hypothetical protein
MAKGGLIHTLPADESHGSLLERRADCDAIVLSTLGYCLGIIAVFVALILLFFFKYFCCFNIFVVVLAW